jgi:succinyl-CoA synthetase alpha subunit
MKPITFDVQYWPGLGGDQPMRVAKVHGDDFIDTVKELLTDPTIRGIQITIEKEHETEFF